MQRLGGWTKYSTREAALLYIKTKLHAKIDVEDGEKDIQWNDWKERANSPSAAEYRFLPCYIKHPGVCCTVDNAVLPSIQRGVKLFKRFMKAHAPGVGSIILVACGRRGGKCVVGFSVTFKKKPFIVAFIPCLHVPSGAAAAGQDFDSVQRISLDWDHFDALPQDLGLLGRLAPLCTDPKACELTVWQSHELSKKVLLLGDLHELRLRRLDFDVIDNIADDTLIIRADAIMLDVPLIEAPVPVAKKVDGAEDFSSFIEQAFDVLHGGSGVHEAPLGVHGGLKPNFCFSESQ